VRVGRPQREGRAQRRGATTLADAGETAGGSVFALGEKGSRGRHGVYPSLPVCHPPTAGSGLAPAPYPTSRAWSDPEKLFMGRQGVVPERNGLTLDSLVMGEGQILTPKKPVCWNPPCWASLTRCASQTGARKRRPGRRAGRRQRPPRPTPGAVAPRALVQEQDAAYQASLAADRAKAEERAETEKSAAQAAAVAEQAAAASAAAEAEAAAVAAARVGAAAACLLPLVEPRPGAPGTVAVAIRLPDGTRLTRRFEAGTARVWATCLPSSYLLPPPLQQQQLTRQEAAAGAVGMGQVVAANPHPHPLPHSAWSPHTRAGS
jgi:hypothetical protein